MRDWLSGLDPVTGTFTLPVWAAGAAVLLFLIALVLALWRAGPSRTVAAFAQVAIVLIAALAAWTFHVQSLQRDRDAERRALDARAAELAARSVMPGSALACLDAIAAESLESSCENAVFASAESTAAALSYIAARLTLLADADSYARERDPSYEPVLADWRRTLETDRFGVVAQVMATRDGCGADACPAFGLLRDTSRVSINLRERAFDQNISRHAAGWGTRAGTPVAAATGPASAPLGAPSPNLASSSTSGPVFPSAASIPAISIMNVEPTGTVQPGAASPSTPAAAATNTATVEPIANPPTPPRRPPPRRPVATAPAAAPAPGPPPAATVPAQ